LRLNDAKLYSAAVVAGLGLIQVPAYDMAEAIRSGHLTDILYEMRAEPMPVAVVAPDRPSRVPAVAAFTTFAEEVLCTRL